MKKLWILIIGLAFLGMEANLYAQHGGGGRDGDGDLRVVAKIGRSGHAQELIGALPVGQVDAAPTPGQAQPCVPGDLIGAQALMLTGDPDGALPIFRRCRDALFDLPGLQAFANVFLALLAEDAGQIAQALELVDRARATIDRHGLVDTPILVSVFGAIARVHARHGDRAIAVAAAERAERLLGRIGPTTVRPQLLNQTLLAGAYVALGDHAHADVSIAEARKLAPLMPQAVLLREYLTDAEARRHPVDLRDRPVGVITGAETRVLELLPTHYTLAEIAEMLFVSRSTVKTQVASIYRKLGVTTRSAAVEAASEQNLIGF